MVSTEDRLYSLSGEVKPNGVSTIVPTQRGSGDVSEEVLYDGRAMGLRRSRTARRPMTPAAVSEGLLDWAVAMASLYFVIFAALVYQHRGEPKDSEWGSALLAAAQYGPTILPIVFSAIVARFLLVLAHARLESGARVLTLEHLLHSRTVFSTFTASINLRSFHVITPILLCLWALSPLGGQASLRIISTEPRLTIVPNNFTYLAFASPFSNAGEDSASANLLVPINAAFTAALITSVDSKTAHQDAYGNIKVPVFDTLAPAIGPNASEWRAIPNDGKVVWSSLTGLPIATIPGNANSTFTLNTGYMTTSCKTSGEDTDKLFRDMNNSTYTALGGWSGSNFAISAMTMTFYGAPAASFVFRALGSGTNQTLSVVNCTTYMHYLEQEVSCQSRECLSIRARPALVPAGHISSAYDNAVVKANLTEYSPLSGLAQPDSMVLNFFKNFINATNPSQACGTTSCPMSGVEGYLIDPSNPFNVVGSPLIWQQGDDLVSRRMTQLINTYWLNSIAPYSHTGNFSGPVNSTQLAYRYNTDSMMGTIETRQVVIKVNMEWMVILLVTAAVMLFCGIYTVVMTMRRRGPDILDNFTALLRNNPYVRDPGYSSMDDAVEQAKRLRDTVVRLGDVRPDDEVGHVAVAATGAGGISVGPLSARKSYD